MKTVRIAHSLVDAEQRDKVMMESADGAARGGSEYFQASEAEALGEALRVSLGELRRARPSEPDGLNLMFGLPDFAVILAEQVNGGRSSGAVSMQAEAVGKAPGFAGVQAAARVGWMKATALARVQA